MTCTYLFFLEAFQSLLISTVQGFLTVGSPLHLAGSDEHLPGPILDPLLSLAQVLLEVETARPKDVFESDPHHVLDVTQPSFDHTLQSDHALQLHLLSLGRVHVCCFKVISHLGHVE